MKEFNCSGSHPTRDDQRHTFSRKKGREYSWLVTGVFEINPLCDSAILDGIDGVPFTMTEMRRDEIAFLRNTDLHAGSGTPIAIDRGTGRHKIHARIPREYLLYPHHRSGAREVGILPSALQAQFPGPLVLFLLLLSPRERGDDIFPFPIQ
jgi:hypothetical protein